MISSLFSTDQSPLPPSCNEKCHVIVSIGWDGGYYEGSGMDAMLDTN